MHKSFSVHPLAWLETDSCSCLLSSWSHSEFPLGSKEDFNLHLYGLLQACVWCFLRGLKFDRQDKHKWPLNHSQIKMLRNREKTTGLWRLKKKGSRLFCNLEIQCSVSIFFFFLFLPGTISFCFSLIPETFLCLQWSIYNNFPSGAYFSMCIFHFSHSWLLACMDMLLYCTVLK